MSSPSARKEEEEEEEVAGAGVVEVEEEKLPALELSLEASLEMKKRGNEFFSLKRYREALEEYTEALESSPAEETKHRAILHANRAACHWELGFFDSCVLECSSAVELNAEYAKAYIRRFRAQEKLDKLDEALEDLAKALELLKLEAVDNKKQVGDLEQERAKLAARVAERNKQLQEEMLGKLKDMGNMFLGKFGMSLDNFKTEQDPQTGSYSVNFKQ